MCRICLPSGRALDVPLDEVAHIGDQLIVLGQHGRGSQRRRSFGAIALWCLARTRDDDPLVPTPLRVRRNRKTV